MERECRGVQSQIHAMKVVLESITRRNLGIIQFSESCYGIAVALQFGSVSFNNGTLNQDFLSYPSMQGPRKPSCLSTHSDEQS